MTCSRQELLKVASVGCAKKKTPKRQCKRYLGKPKRTIYWGRFAYFYLLNLPANKLIWESLVHPPCSLGAHLPHPLQRPCRDLIGFYRESCEHRKIPASSLFQKKRKEKRGNTTSVCSCSSAEREIASPGGGQHPSPGRRPGAASTGPLEDPATRGYCRSTDLTHDPTHPSQSSLKWHSTSNLGEKSTARSSRLAEGTLQPQGSVLNRGVILYLPYRLQQTSKYWEFYVCNVKSAYISQLS